MKITRTLGERGVSKHIQYFRERTAIPEYYQVHLGSKDFTDGNVRLLPFEAFCRLKKIP